MTAQVNKIKPKKETSGKKTARTTKQNSFVRGTHDVLDGSFIRKGNLGQKVFFILFIASLGLVYIANNHLSEKKIREIDRLMTVNKELGFDYQMMKTKLNAKKRASYLATKLEVYGIKPSVEPPEKILANP